MHPIEVGDIVSTMTQDEEIISAAVLHDTIEDCEGVSREILAREFSERVANSIALLIIMVPLFYRIWSLEPMIRPD